MSGPLISIFAVYQKIIKWFCCLTILMSILGVELSCYVHGVTQMINSGSSRYATCQLQTESEMVKAICFSPEKIGPPRHAMTSKSPVKIKKFEYNNKFNNIVIKNNTAFTPSADPLSLQRIASLETHMVTTETLKKTSPQQLVNLRTQPPTTSFTCLSFTGNCWNCLMLRKIKKHAAITEDDLTDILLEMDDLNITLNLADNKLLHIY